jgi:hypothetical protein
LKLATCVVWEILAIFQTYHSNVQGNTHFQKRYQGLKRSTTTKNRKKRSNKKEKPRSQKKRDASLKQPPPAGVLAREHGYKKNRISKHYRWLGTFDETHRHLMGLLSPSYKKVS